MSTNNNKKKRQDIYSLGLLYIYIYVKDFALKTIINSSSGINTISLDIV